MKSLLLSTLFSFLFINVSYSQSSSIKGVLQDTDGYPVMYANIALYTSSDSSLVKVETSDEEGSFLLAGLNSGSYWIQTSFVGLSDYQREVQLLGDAEELDLGFIGLTAEGVELETAVVTARRAIVEVKSDRTVFNVQGTINSSGDNGLELLRKAPGVLVDNNNNITVLGRSGVQIYVDGKRLPLSGDDLSNYLQNLNSEQIDKIDIITNPGARYEAEGNAGIIDIRLKRNENHGTNGSISNNTTKATFWSDNASLNLNHKNAWMNTYSQFSFFKNRRFQGMEFNSFQNGFNIAQTSENISNTDGMFFCWGTDFNIGDNQTIGFLVSGNKNSTEGDWESESVLAEATSGAPVDSILRAENNSMSDFNSQTANINYLFRGDKSNLNIDVDYGRYRRDADVDQPNIYYAPDGETVKTVVNSAYMQPNDIDIYTFKLDYESDLAGGRLGLGTKLSRVETDNTFLFFNVMNGQRERDDRRSNLFFYDENVYAVYGNYSKSLSEKINMNAGLRIERTDATGDLQAFLEELQEPKVELEYTSFFPSAGLSYTFNPQHVFSLNYSRRINRPDYNVLNPFKSQVNELGFMKGNPFLQPEIVNNYEFGFLWKYRYNLKLAYSRTTDQITRLIGPDDSDPRASFINWDNLAEQVIYSLNISAPVQISKKWNAYFNFSASHINNQANYGDGVIVDIQALNYNIYQQHTITLPYGFTGEISGWFSGPGVWGGVFEYDPSYSLNFGLQKKFLDDKLNIRLSVQDVTRQAGWSGVSNFNGLTSMGAGYWDSRRGSVSASYRFGNEKVKSKDRKSGLEEEASRVGGQ